MSWIMENKETIFAALGVFYTLATIVATLTPTGKDDTILAKIGAIADRLGLKLKK